MNYGSFGYDIFGDSKLYNGLIYFVFIAGKNSKINFIVINPDNGNVEDVGYSLIIYFIFLNIT